MPTTFRVLALIAAHNEEDIIGACIDHLFAQGVESYLMDDGSTDATVERATARLGRGLLGIERLPVLQPPTFSLDRILARKESLARELEASWFINQDADEFRESLWAELDLRSAIQTVDRLGWNAIDFQIFTMRLVGEPATARVSPSDDGGWYSPAEPFDKKQIRCWKRTDAPVELRSSGGHDSVFDGRRVFPMRFPMRHYPIRSQEHGERKIFTERVPRFDTAEVARSWHVQYRGFERGAALTANPDELRQVRADARQDRGRAEQSGGGSRPPRGRGREIAVQN